MSATGGPPDRALRELRTSAHMSQQEVARRVGTSQGTVSQRERLSVLDVPPRTLVEHIRATDPLAVVTVSASGVVVAGSALHLVVEAPRGPDRAKRSV